MKNVREAFLKYFEDRGHTRVRSASLIAKDDPTLLFVNAGMVPFKEYFTGKKSAPFPRAVSSQKCLRVSGKHNDFENVGRTPRHHTFFEMLGNFSFGDYFKKEAIAFAWEFLTKELGLPKERLIATVYTQDDEAYGLWQEIAALPKDRIVRLGKEHCFWSMGDTGPCGPCSEVLIDLGPSRSCGKPTCGVGCDCDRYLELWNLVFMSYDQTPSGEVLPLPKPSIDTGMGLERILSVIEGALSNYETSLFTPIRKALLSILPEDSNIHKEPKASAIRVILDHSRAASFLVLDGLLPSNEGHGYVLKRIIRRALRFGRLLGLDEPFLNRLTPSVALAYEDAYPELKAQLKSIQGVIQNEEERFLNTLDRGLKLLEEEILKLGPSGVLPGGTAFQLYDTYGFPIDLIEEILKEQGLQYDKAGFDEAMAAQRERARSKKAFGRGFLAQQPKEDLKLPPSRFIGYQTLTSKGLTLKVLDVGPSEEILAVFEKTPFYPEGGGQLADTGQVQGDGFLAYVIDVQRQEGSILHRLRVQSGALKEGIEVELRVDSSRREARMRAHTATHLLHAALRRLLGEHVRQAGSLVDSDRLRFDFTHFAPLTTEQVCQLEIDVQNAILQDIPVSISKEDYQEALKKGALAFFGDKYADEVRIVEVPGVSMELCGGTHVERTGRIGPFRIVQETSIGSDLRRIEAYVGLLALKQTQDDTAWIQEAVSILKTTRTEFFQRLQATLEELEKIRRANAELKRKQLALVAGEILGSRKQLGELPLVCAFLDDLDMPTLRELGLLIKESLPLGALILGSKKGDSGYLIVQVHGKGLKKDQRPNARQILEAILSRTGGKGGGREDFAQAGGLDPTALREALDLFPQSLGHLGLG